MQFKINYWCVHGWVPDFSNKKWCDSKGMRHILSKSIGRVPCYLRLPQLWDDMVKIRQKGEYLKHVKVIYLLVKCLFFTFNCLFGDGFPLSGWFRYLSFASKSSYWNKFFFLFFKHALFFLYFISCLEKVLLVHPQEVLASLNKQATYLVNNHNNHNNHLLLGVRFICFIHFIINILL